LFYILELVVNSVMIAEVGIRLVAFGKVRPGCCFALGLIRSQSFWSSHWNTLDLVIALVSVITIAVIFAQGCSAKGEELFDTLLLVARNLLQFGRLALVFRRYSTSAVLAYVSPDALHRSGKSIFSRVPAIDLETARDASLSLDLDLDDEEQQLADEVLRSPKTARAPHPRPSAEAAQPFMLAGEGDSDEDT
jgi:hypothetical protein